MIAGLGIDLVEVPRIKAALDKWGTRFLERVFTSAEIAYCNSKSVPAIHFAARFAAKEAFLKSLGLGFGQGIKLNDIEILSDRKGKPIVNFKNEAQAAGAMTVQVSLTHTGTLAVAVVVVER